MSLLARLASFLPAAASTLRIGAPHARRCLSAAATDAAAAAAQPAYVIQELPAAPTAAVPRGTSVVRSIRGHAKKLSPLARQVAGLGVNEALAQLAFSSSQRAQHVARAVARACKQVELFHGLPRGDLMVEAAWTGKHTSSPRIRHHSKMRAGRAHKRTSQVTLRVRAMSPAEAAKRNRFPSAGAAEAASARAALSPRGY
jgi:ribosomal protein L22